MKSKTHFITLAFFSLFAGLTYGQGGLPGNNRPPGGNPLGWLTGTAGPLDIRNDFNQPIDFYTSTQARMRLTAGGFLGIGLANPSNMLHVHDGVNSFLQVTTTGIGNTATDGLKVGMLSTSTNAIIANQEAGRLLFATSGAFIGNTRMTITATGLVGIGNNFLTPQNQLHLHNNAVGGNFIFIQITNALSGSALTDGLVFGLGTPLNTDAVIMNLEQTPMHIGVSNVQSQDIFIDNDPAQLYPNVK